MEFLFGGARFLEVSWRIVEVFGFWRFLGGFWRCLVFGGFLEDVGGVWFLEVSWRILKGVGFWRFLGRFVWRWLVVGAPKWFGFLDVLFGGDSLDCFLLPC